MRFFASSHRIDQLMPRTRMFLIALFVGVLLQGISGLLMQHVRGGWTAESISSYYRGDESSESTEFNTANDAFGISSNDMGHADLEPIDINELDEIKPLAVPRDFGSILEVAHFHLAFLPILVFLVIHVYAMCPLGRGRWGGWLGFSGAIIVLIDIISPFLVRYHHESWAWVKLIAFLGLSALIFILGFICMISLAWSLYKRQGTGMNER